MPTVADRIAQTVVARRLEAKVEPIFHPDSYGYRPNRSALDAVAACRQRCWKSDWVIDLDIQKFFDSVAVGAHGQGGGGARRRPVGAAVCQAVAGCAAALPDGTLQTARPGNPARVGGLARAGEPVPALRVRRLDGPGVPEPSSSSGTPTTWSCTAPPKARPGTWWWRSGTGWPRSGCDCIPTRPGSCTARTETGGLDYEHTAFTFLGFTFRARGARDEERRDLHRLLARDQQGRPEQDEQEVRRWRLHRCTGHTLADLARQINPIVRGWMQYYGAFYRTALDPLLPRINAYLVRWLRTNINGCGHQEGPGLLAAHHPPTAAALRPLGMDADSW